MLGGVGFSLEGFRGFSRVSFFKTLEVFVPSTTGGIESLEGFSGFSCSPK